MHRIRENILLGFDPSAVTEYQLNAACRDALIYDFIASLHESYNTGIGSRGIALSGGQKQRIDIARALIRESRLFSTKLPVPWTRRAKNWFKLRLSAQLKDELRLQLRIGWRLYRMQMSSSC